MAYNRNNGYGSAGGIGNNAGGNYNNAGADSDGLLETEELSAEDYAIISAGFGVLGELFAFLSLVKAKQVTKETGGQVGTGLDPFLFVQSRTKKTARRKSRRLR
ncbi:hypothetical protein KDC22_22075 [Paenibacillus tritici]|uniref:hypothetical protein n=1 Tax=Paenibacillus tritici TaxID=1873425 RepID=UPI001BA8B8B8|nr:hypothetical protein [Paenibacillus tritici]QUL58525.1 hypothetical protein KDC22_22075 [Paenibacillus tritici]